MKKDLSREEFIDYIKSEKGVDVGPESALWIPEEVEPVAHFVRFVCVFIPINEVDNFFAWCKENLKGEVRCFSSDASDEEWWGFTDPDDVLIWSLRWA